MLDQSPIPAGGDAGVALRNSIDLAQLTESLGYTRYWVAEHHGTGGLAGSAPEILIAHIASATSSIRVGSGGVMLPHYSALKVAEQFGMLETLHLITDRSPGLGRASPGSDGITSLALQRNRRAPASDDFAEQLAELLAWFEDSFPESHPFRPVTASPTPDAPPEIWLLTSSGWSARAAATFGVGIAFAHFISAEGGPQAIAQYKREFTPRHLDDRPKSSVAVGVVCADTDVEADRLASSARLWRYRQRQLGIRGPVPSVEDALADPHGAKDDAFASLGVAKSIVGSPAQARESSRRSLGSTTSMRW